MRQQRKKRVLQSLRDALPRSKKAKNLIRSPTTQLDSALTEESKTEDVNKTQEDKRRYSLPNSVGKSSSMLLRIAMEQFRLSLPPVPQVDLAVIPSAKSSVMKTLVLDLDETLVHCSLDPLPTYDFALPVLNSTIYGKKRPHLDKFLNEVKGRFEIVLFTAGVKTFANAVLDHLDPEHQIFHHRLFRDMCYITKGSYIKNLLLLGRSLELIIIVDDKPESFAFQLENGIHIPPWTGDNPDDTQLLKLLDILLHFETSTLKARDFIAECGIGI